MADENSQHVPATSGRSEVAPLTEVSPGVVTETNGAIEDSTKREKTWGETDLQRAQVEGVEHEDEGDPESVAVNHGAVPKKKKKKSKSKGQRGLVDPTDIQVIHSQILTGDSGQAYRFRRILRRCSSDTRRVQRRARLVQQVRRASERDFFDCY